jgi:hypothetical protein
MNHTGGREPGLPVAARTNNESVAGDEMSDIVVHRPMRRACRIPFAERANLHKRTGNRSGEARHAPA